MSDTYILLLIGLVLLGAFIYILKDVYQEYGIIDMWGKIFSWEDRIKKELGISEERWLLLSLDEKEVIRDIAIKARSEGVKFLISNEDKIDYVGDSNIKVSGYFDGGGSILGIAIGKDKKEWFPILLHESSHMDQWREGIQLWKDIVITKGDIIDSEFEGRDVYDLMDEYVGGTEFKEGDLNEILLRCIRLELDCERRTFRKIIDYSLKEYDQFEYIQKANSYIMFYGAIKKYRKWYKKPPYEIKEVWSQMPYYFLEDYNKYLNPSQDKLELFEKHCF